VADAEKVMLSEAKHLSAEWARSVAQTLERRKMSDLTKDPSLRSG